MTLATRHSRRSGSGHTREPRQEWEVGCAGPCMCYSGTDRDPSAVHFTDAKNSSMQLYKKLRLLQCPHNRTALCYRIQATALSRGSNAVLFCVVHKSSATLQTSAHGSLQVNPETLPGGPQLMTRSRPTTSFDRALSGTGMLRKLR